MILHFLSTFQLVGELFYMSIIADNDSKFIAFVKARHSEFLMSDIGPLRYFLETEVSSTFNGFFISQEKYIQDFLALNDERTMKLNFHLCIHLRSLAVRLGIRCLVVGYYVCCLDPTSCLPLLGGRITAHSGTTIGEQEHEQASF